MKRIKLLLFSVILFASIYGQDKNSTIDAGKINLLSTKQTKIIDELYQQAETKISELEAEVIKLKKEKKENKLFESQYQSKLDSLNKLTSLQSSLLFEKNNIIGSQEKIIERKNDIIKGKDEIINKKDIDIANYIDSLKRRDFIIDSLRNIISQYTIFDKPKKKQIITLYGRSYKANETIVTIEFDDKNRPVITTIDSIKLSIIYALAKDEDRKLILTSRKNFESKKLNTSQIPGGEPWPDNTAFVDLIEILRARIVINFRMQGDYLINNPVKNDFGKRVYISLSK